jgi:hypothetical protein
MQNWSSSGLLPKPIWKSKFSACLSTLDTKKNAFALDKRRHSFWQHRAASFFHFQAHDNTKYLLNQLWETHWHGKLGNYIYNPPFIEGGR